MSMISFAGCNHFWHETYVHSYLMLFPPPISWPDCLLYCQLDTVDMFIKGYYVFYLFHIILLRYNKHFSFQQGNT